MLETNKAKGQVEDYVPLRDIVFQKLRESIVTGALKPGERLMEIKLANEMGVSRTPVREAIRKLQVEGLVIMNARRGAIVAPINEQDLKELLEIRKALESLACRLVSVRASADELEELRGINKKMEQAVAACDISLITEYDVAFHERITELARNSHLTQMLDQIKEHLYRYRLAFIKELGNRNVLVEEHNRILDAMAAGDVNLAGHEIEKHIEHQEDFILNALSK